MPGRILTIEPVAPDAKVPRGHPCGAFPGGKQAACGATPAEEYVKTCLHRHTRVVRLCATHLGEAMTARITCRDCAQDRTHPHDDCPVGVHPLPQD